MLTAAVQVVDLQVWYAQAQVLNGLNLYAMPGEIVVLLGRNGSGRRAALRAIFGQSDERKGSVRVVGTETINAPSETIAHLGLSFLPAEASIFGHLSCEENLLLPASENDTLGGGMSLRQIYEVCPDLETRSQTLATRLSLAEQRMLGIARILRTGASVLLMDDIANGLSPFMTQAFARLIRALKAHGYTILMAEHDTGFCAPLADRFYVMDRGALIDTFGPEELPQRQEQLSRLLGGDTP